jgi:hypothetical protein
MFHDFETHEEWDDAFDTEFANANDVDELFYGCRSGSSPTEAPCDCKATHVAVKDSPDTDCKVFGAPGHMAPAPSVPQPPPLHAPKDVCSKSDDKVARSPSPKRARRVGRSTWEVSSDSESEGEAENINNGAAIVHLPRVKPGTPEMCQTSFRGGGVELFQHIPMLAGCEWWQAPLLVAVQDIRSKLPPCTTKPYTTMHCCLGAGTDLLAFEVLSEGSMSNMFVIVFATLVQLLS